MALMPEDFKDISIVELDIKKSYKPDTTKGLFNMYLKLSGTPSPEWAQIFEAERNFPRHTMWRRAWIEGSSIVIHCVPEELEKYHLKDLKEDCTNVNIKYREYLVKLSQRRKAEETQMKNQENELIALKNRLKL